MVGTVNAVLFDLDGTLADTRHAVTRVWRAAARHIDVPFAAIEPHIHGIPADQVPARVACSPPPGAARPIPPTRTASQWPRCAPTICARNCRPSGRAWR